MFLLANWGSRRGNYFLPFGRGLLFGFEGAHGGSIMIVKKVAKTLRFDTIIAITYLMDSVGEKEGFCLSDSLWLLALVVGQGMSS